MTGLNDRNDVFAEHRGSRSSRSGNGKAKSSSKKKVAPPSPPPSDDDQRGRESKQDSRDGRRKRGNSANPDTPKTGPGPRPKPPKPAQKHDSAEGNEIASVNSNIVLHEGKYYYENSNPLYTVTQGEFDITIDDHKTYAVSCDSKDSFISQTLTNCLNRQLNTSTNYRRYSYSTEQTKSRVRVDVRLASGKQEHAYLYILSTTSFQSQTCHVALGKELSKKLGISHLHTTLSPSEGNTTYNQARFEHELPMRPAVNVDGYSIGSPKSISADEYSSTLPAAMFNHDHADEYTQVGVSYGDQSAIGEDTFNTTSTELYRSIASPPRAGPGVGYTYQISGDINSYPAQAAVYEGEEDNIPGSNYC
ncbi:hypothetical protein PVAG01_06886 [Phlyctema vagabunda]|uniref:Uncharacterized protein n=1 Tax=Phlyctema vagabunda TaxID=108571 RepID=A0ABR4PHB8_9HELO